MDSGRETVSSRSGPIRATERPRNLVSNDACLSDNHAVVVPSVTSSHNRPHHSKHSRQNSLDSLTSCLSQKLTVNSSSRNGTTLSSPILHQHQPQQHQRIIKSASTSHLAGHAPSARSTSSVSNNNSQCLRDICPPLNAVRLRPTRHETRNSIVSKCAMLGLPVCYICYKCTLLDWD